MSNNKIIRWLVDVFHVWRREFMLAFHDQGVIVFFLVLCAVYPIVYSLIYNPEIARDVAVVVVDDCRQADSRELVRELDATPEVRVAGYAANMQEARRMVNEKQCYGIVYVPRDYSHCLGRGEAAHVNLYCDMSVLMRYKQMLMGLTAVQKHITMQALGRKVSIVTSQMGGVIGSRQVALGNESMGLASSVLLCIFILVLQQSMLLGIGMLRAGSRERRLHHGGIDPMDVGAGVGATIIGKTLCHWIIYIVPTVYVLHFVPMFFDFPQNGDMLDIIAMALPFLLASSLLGQCMQVFVNDRESVFLAVVFTSVPFVFLTGISWPRYAIGPMWTALANMVPSTWASEAYILMQSDGASLAQTSHHYAMLWVLVAVYFVIAYCVERFLLRPRYRRMAVYEAMEPGSLLREEYRRNGVDNPVSVDSSVGSSAQSEPESTCNK